MLIKLQSTLRIVHRAVRVNHPDVALSTRFFGVSIRQLAQSKESRPNHKRWAAHAPDFETAGLTEDNLQLLPTGQVEREPRLSESKEWISESLTSGNRTGARMGQRFSEIAFTPGVKDEQLAHNSRKLYERMQQPGRAPDALGNPDALGPYEKEFIEKRDGFYMASVSETGWPYIQYRGGARGFLRVLDERTLGFADLRGNKQYISTGNLKKDNRVALFLMDYAAQSRLKILGHVEIHEHDTRAQELRDTRAQELIDQLRVPGEKTPVERALLIHVEGFDWNCPQHITPRYTQDELAELLAPMRQRMQELERENERLRSLEK
jgi:predicted pyridoxine 5'-phosphate oxidase superfamily flavin-nucleotide-binding protein